MSGVLKENYSFLILVTVCITGGSLLSKGVHIREISYDEWLHVLLRTGCTLSVQYLVMLGLCLAKITSKAKLNFVTKLIMTLVISGLILLIPVMKLYDWFGAVCACLSVVWLLLQGLHFLDNTQVLHNFIVLNILNVKRGPSAATAENFSPEAAEASAAEIAAASRRSQSWLYIHLASSFTVIFVVYYIGHHVNALIHLAADYDVGCIAGSHMEVVHQRGMEHDHDTAAREVSDDYIRKMYNTHLVCGVVLVILSLPRFTNKGMLIPLLLYVYQLHLMLIILLVQTDACDNSIAFKAILDDNERAHVMHALQTHSYFLRSSVLLLSSTFTLATILYNLGAPNLVSLRNLIRGSLWDRRISTTSEAVSQSMLRYTNNEAVGENARLLEAGGASGGYGATGVAGGATSSSSNAASIAAGRDQPSVPFAMSDEDRAASPVPAFFIYFVLICAYLPMLLSQWGMLVRHEETGSYTTMTLEDGTKYEIISEDGTGSSTFDGLGMGTGGYGSGLIPSKWVPVISGSLFSISVILWLIFSYSLFVSYMRRDSI